MNDITYIGWIASEETAQVYIWKSDYKTTKAINNNIMRCMNRQTGVSMGSLIKNAKIFTANQDDKCYESAEQFAADNVTEDMRQYELSETEFFVTSDMTAMVVFGAEIFNISKEYGANSKLVKELFDCWCYVTDAVSYSEEANAFREAFDCMRGGKAAA